MQQKWLVIINPVSGGKAAPKRWAKIQPILEAAGIGMQVAYTEYRDHGAKLASEAVKQGFRHILILGGDGTANDVVNGVMQSGIAPQEMVLAMIPAGTGNDWVRTIGKPQTTTEIVSALQNIKTQLHDVGIARYTQGEEKRERYFINIAGLGFEGAVAQYLFEHSGKFYFGKLQYQLAIMRTLFRYKHTRMRITTDQGQDDLTVLSVAVGNGKYNGGGLKQLPSANFNDGQLDMTIITTMPKWKMVVSLPKLQSGAHVHMREVQTFKSKSITIHSDPPVSIDADGEYIGSTPLELAIAPQQIQVLVWTKLMM